MRTNLVEKLTETNPEIKIDIVLLYKYARYDQKDKFVEKLNKLLRMAENVGITDTITRIEISKK